VPTAALPKITAEPSLPTGTDVLVLGFDGQQVVGAPPDLETQYTDQLGRSLSELAAGVGAKAAADHTRVLPALGSGPRLLVIGLGEDEPTLEALRRAAGSAVRSALSGTESGAISVAVSLGASEAETISAVAEGALLGSYRYTPARADSDSDSGSIGSLVVIIPSTAGKEAAGLLKRASVVAQAVAQAREWVNLPPNLLFPDSFAGQVRAVLKDARVGVEVLDEKALERGGYGGILAVGSGSSRPPRLVRLSYAPRGARKHLALVGKGITFDSGGLNLKPAEGMYTMKCDMAGAAAVFAAVQAIAGLGLKVKVTAYGSLAENLPSDTAYRPSDVLTMYGGKTVENGNTDAEGRLVMADALVRASEDSPDLLVDVATLTGAAIVALGTRTAGVMATDDDTADQILDAAESAGEEVWQLPIPAETRARLDSKVADLRSTAGDRAGGALVAAAFLREFVGEGVSWAHLDIAGPAFEDGSPYGYVTSGGTGAGVRTLVALAASLAD
jgi:leucyl aminopeptidase